MDEDSSYYNYIYPYGDDGMDYDGMDYDEMDSTVDQFRRPFRRFDRDFGFRRRRFGFFPFNPFFPFFSFNPFFPFFPFGHFRRF